MIEIVPIKELNAEITVPGSKYIANRALIIAALADGVSEIGNVPENEDINALINSLNEFGVKIEKKASSLVIHGGKLSVPKKEINVQNSGTLMRFICSFSALVDGKTTVTGSERIKERPIDDLLKSLEDLGIKTDSNKGFCPVTIHGGSLLGGKTRIKGDVSSQFISSILLASPYAKKSVEIEVETELLSKNYVDMTISLMEEFGVKVERHGYSSFLVKPQKYKHKNYTISGDWSSASYFLAAAMLIPGSIKLNSMDMKSKQGEAKFPEVLVKTGGMLRKNSTWLQLMGFNEKIPLDIDMGDMPDVVQTLAVIAAVSNGTTRIWNIKHLASKESNRIKDTAAELRKIGIKAEDKEDELIIHGGNPHGAIIDPHNDHRMAMSFAVLGLKIPGIKIQNPECVNKSFPGFWEKLRDIGAEIKHV